MACDEKCGSCKGPGSDNCTSCESHQFLHHHTCVHACPSGTYVATDQQSMTARCLQCADPSCAQCSRKLYPCFVFRTDRDRSVLW